MNHRRSTQVANSAESGRDKRRSSGDRRGFEQRNAGGSGAGSAFPTNAPNTRIEERESGGADRGVALLNTEQYPVIVVLLWSVQHPSLLAITPSNPFVEGLAECGSSVKERFADLVIVTCILRREQCLEQPSKSSRQES